MGSKGSLLPSSAFPGLRSDNHEITSPATPRYNCIAWAAGDPHRWWWPDLDEVAFWRTSAPRQVTIPSFLAAFEAIGYRVCDGGDIEPGYAKVALYALDGTPTHAAHQLPDGRWSSKLGRSVDIAHTHDALDGPVYGKAVVFLRRSSQGATTA